MDTAHIKLAEYLIKKCWHSVTANRILLQVDGNNHDEWVNNLAATIKRITDKIKKESS